MPTKEYISRGIFKLQYLNYVIQSRRENMLQKINYMICQIRLYNSLSPKHEEILSFEDKRSDRC